MAKHKVVITGVDTSNLTVLSSDDTIKLIKEYRNGNVSAKDEAVLGNLKLVLSIVNQFTKRADNLDDLFQVGVVGLIKGIDNFSLEHDVKFSTYAVPMILGEIKRYLRDSTFLHVSRQIKDRAYKALKAKEEYIAKYQKEPTYEELASILDVSYFDIVECFDALMGVSYLSEPLYNDFEESLELIDVIPAESDNIKKMLNYFSLEEGIRNLDDMEKTIIKKRYFEGQTQLEIAEEFAISQAQVSRLEKNALKRLKTYF